MLMDKMKELKTHPGITSFFHNVVGKVSILDKLMEDLEWARLIYEQKIIGMYNFIIGSWTQEWKRQQRKYAAERGYKQQSNTWAKKHN